jgi:hypothetical protein
MLLNWSLDFLNAVMSTLTDEQRAALHLAAETTGSTKPSGQRLKKAGFASLADYTTALEAARAKAKGFMSVWGITGINSLDFAQPGQSAEGRIQKRSGNGKTRGQ